MFEANVVERYPKFREMITLFRKRHPELISHVAPTDEGFVGYKGRRLLSILNKAKVERVLAYFNTKAGLKEILFRVLEPMNWTPSPLAAALWKLRRITRSRSTTTPG